MERREHYQPEDIESLLHERGFDELLQEERAFVLLHLSGREEYEAMRALLSKVREDDRRNPPITADPGTRDRVMATFRSQQQPQWQVWLNSLGALLWPKEMKAMPLLRHKLWRPALAIASIALLIVAGIQVSKMTSNEAAQPQLAELKKEPAKDLEPNDKLLSPPLADQQTSTMLEEVGLRPAAGAVATETASGSTVMEPMSVENEEATAFVAVDEVATEQAEALNTSMDMAAAEKKSEVAAAAPTVSGTASHTVTQEELNQNMSVVNAGTRARKVDADNARRDAARTVGNLAEQPALLALLNTGW